MNDQQSILPSGVERMRNLRSREEAVGRRSPVSGLAAAGRCASLRTDDRRPTTDDRRPTTDDPP
jgi:hypothetical protein